MVKMLKALESDAEKLLEIQQKVTRRRKPL